MSKLSLCPVCCEGVDLTSKLICCPRCWTILAGDTGALITRHQGGVYNFCDQGWFAYLGNQEQVGEEYPPFISYRERIRPLLEKVVGHVLWMLFWGACLPIWSFFAPESRFAYFPSYLFLTLIAVHLLLLGSYWSALMMQGLLRPLLYLSSWDKVIRMVRKGALVDAEDAMRRLHLEHHPGFLTNLALGYFQAGDVAKSEYYMDKARLYLPSHPMSHSS
jgi:hypothetical protein